MTEPVKADPSPQWLECPGCQKHLAKKIASGRYETAMKKSAKVQFRVEIVMGSIVCPRCGARMNIPPSANQGAAKEKYHGERVSP
jgi:ribosomal protein L34E